MPKNLIEAYLLLPPGKLICFHYLSGEAKWTVEEAENELVPVPVIKESLEFRRRSKEDPEIQKSFAAKLVASLRKSFGGHEVKKI